ncbi:MAG TPA: N-acetylmuramoyl-L-alanine amidase [Solirubrobacterales bacterium]|nr:N-acetylmuramoyl-L-alanine amidase [Solirubrobacterales bacterium]
MRRRLGYLLLGATLAVAGWTAAPALSVDPYLPEAEDFEQRVPAVERVAGVTANLRAAGSAADAHADEGPVSHRSGVIAAPKRFDLAGIAGELRAYELRARTAGGEWSDWVETGDGNPVYFGEADELQLRTRGWRPSGRLHYVNVSGTTSLGDRILNGARKTINGAFISVAGTLLPSAEAEVPKPDMVKRGEWGANRSSGGCKPRRKASYGKVRAAVVHHTVTANAYSKAEAPGIVLGICRFHRNGNGWDDIGYNALTDRFGTIYVGRAGGIGKPVIGAQAQGFNWQTTGMAVLGTHTSEPIRKLARRAFGRFFAWKLRHGKPIGSKVWLESAGGPLARVPKGKKIQVKRVIGHRRLNTTACPGNEGRRQVKRIRRIANRIRTENETPAKTQ